MSVIAVNDVVTVAEGWQSLHLLQINVNKFVHRLCLAAARDGNIFLRTSFFFFLLSTAYTLGRRGEINRRLSAARWEAW